MKKLILSALAPAALAGSVYRISAIATPGAPDSAMREGDRGFRLDAKLAGMKAALTLTPEQDKSWLAFETAVRDAVRMRDETKREGRDEREGADPPPRLSP